jgi:hypothetical protein
MFALAGEWPWEDDPDVDGDREALLRAARKLQEDA